jgi:ATP-dependent DNA helicase RecQ
MSGQRQKAVVELIDFLTASGYLQAVGGQYPTLTVTASGVDVLKGNTTVHRKTAQTVQQTVPENSALFEQLRTLRRQLAEEQGVPPFVIFSDKTLHSMCEVMPEDDQAFLTVKGVGASKLEKYGETFMATIRAAAHAEAATEAETPATD